MPNAINIVFRSLGPNISLVFLHATLPPLSIVLSPPVAPAIRIVFANIGPKGDKGDTGDTPVLPVEIGSYPGFDFNTGYYIFTQYDDDDFASLELYNGNGGSTIDLISKSSSSSGWETRFKIDPFGTSLTNDDNGFFGIYQPTTVAGGMTVKEPLSLLINVSDGNGAAGLGGGIGYYIENSTGGIAALAGRISYEWTVATAGAETSKYLVRGKNSGSDVDFISITTAGTVTFGTKVLTLGGNLTTSGAFNTTFTVTGSNTITFPNASITVARTDAAQTFTGSQTFSQVLTTNNAITASGNAATLPITSAISTVTNNSAATLTITLTTTSAIDGQMVTVRVLDFSAAAQTITWVNTENSSIAAPTTSNGSTTLFLTVRFVYNNATSKWRCIGYA